MPNADINDKNAVDLIFTAVVQEYVTLFLTPAYFGMHMFLQEMKQAFLCSSVIQDPCLQVPLKQPNVCLILNACSLSLK